MTPRLHPLDPHAAQLLATLGLAAHPPADADAFVVAHPDGFARLWGLRAWGATAPALCVGSLPEQRALLEPLVTASPTVPGLSAAAASVPPPPCAQLWVPSGCVDLARRVVRRDDGRTVPLTQQEADLVAFLAARPRPVSREELRTAVWGHQRVDAPSRGVDMAVRRLRAKVERRPDAPEVLLTCRGDGYRWVQTAASARLSA